MGDIADGIYIVTKDLKKINKEESSIRVYKMRWIVLLLFTLNTIVGTTQLMIYVAVTDVIRQYYQTSYTAIEWTYMIYSLLYAMFVLPGSHIVEKLGIRKAVLLSSLGTLVGMCIKLGSVHPDRFWMAFLGQTIVCASQVFQSPLLPKLAATWFGYNQIATACSFGIVGFQIGMSLSFLLPPFFVKGSNSEIEHGIATLNISYAVLAGFVFLILILGFSNAPPKPPSIAQQNFNKEREENPVPFTTSIKSLFSNRNYIIFITIAGINAGSVTTFIILSNQIILKYYTDGAYHVGILGLMSVCFGIAGSTMASILMDKFKKFRLIAITAYICFGLSMLLYTITLTLGMIFVYISQAMIGTFFGSVITIAIEVVVELTYPQAQNLAAGVSTACGQMAAIVVTSIYGPIFRSIGFYYASGILLATVLVTDFLFIFMKFDLRRQAAQLKTYDAELKKF